MDAQEREFNGEKDDHIFIVVHGVFHVQKVGQLNSQIHSR